MDRDAGTVLLLDGATGTELDRRGVDVGLPLWSARAMLDAPEVLEAVHRDYLESGAEAVTTNTFRTHRRSLAKEGYGDRAESLTRDAVAIAAAARDAINPEAMVLGSVAPLEDCYTPDLAPDADACRREHTELIEQLVEAGVDLVLVQTMSSAHESLAAAAAAEACAPGNWAISFCLAPGEPGVLMDGTPLTEVVPELGSPRFVGINCIAATLMADQVRHLRSIVDDGTPVAACGNVGYPDDEVGWINTDAIEPGIYASHVQDWIEAGAGIVGGCCGTTPATIRAIRDSLPS
ncbi:MAG TPA: homocysteine S-methyltransferase family protein [Phycisphaerales bacterium]|nr:homocysteine S-methyltransferase family protein [Phycisphaerales bacterium]